MQRPFHQSIIPIFAILLLLMACNLPQNKGGQTNSTAVNTSIAQTVQAMQTQSAAGTAITPGTITQMPATITAPNNTQPSATVIPATPVPATATQVPCNQARFMEDVSIPDNTIMVPNQVFTKTWRLMNVGSCAWTLDYALVFVDGNAMGAPAAITFPKTVQPGQTVDLALQMTAPGSAGSYKGNWKVRSNTGQVFGIGGTANNPFWVQIVVGEAAKPIDPNAVLNFAASYCSAKWSTDKGPIACPTTGTNLDGAVSVDNNPRLEENYQDDEPAIIMVASSGANGMISGRYPPVNVKAGDKFGALVGCVAGATQCNVTIQVNYVADGGPVQSLGSWTEKYDGQWTRINVDLGALVGKSVEFILQVGNNGSNAGDMVFWLSPTIVR